MKAEAIEAAEVVPGGISQLLREAIEAGLPIVLDRWRRSIPETGPVESTRLELVESSPTPGPLGRAVKRTLEIVAPIIRPIGLATGLAIAGVSGGDARAALPTESEGRLVSLHKRGHIKAAA